MKKYWKLIVGVAAFAVFMVIAGVAYKNLSQEYKPQQNLVTQNAGANSQSEAGNTGSGGVTDESENSIGNEGVADVGESSGDNTGESGAGNGDGSGAGNNGMQENAEDGNASAGANGENQESSSEETTSENLAPNFTVETADGEEVSLHDFFGKPIILNFWASWCGPCKMELPDFQDAYEKYAGEIEFIMVNMTDGMQETKEIAMKYMEDAGYTLPVYYDTAQDAAYTYMVYSLPTTFFISADGEPVAYAQGMIDAETLETGISMIYP